ncbi:hypothetical protein SAMD00019534_090980 [Acytostelium subglobosum LB1]|uniref:hypothetical protein n=1 Tax=Acytostelium subglobosum LB1 TaxID=1410327 RepID=UPI000645141D|nr:hypothetical protein SAMD00019534_090980 [Acytostelium subglobosum LB1]GAM25923.1 hypothetical protein SAMD00019534_090980 [Acytostelium subglobosum LB1]|eukprot:XP_012750966.1 hypothetical protein SAMD00019534_090980 [Acytostelium subglobosum LB1]
MSDEATVIKVLVVGDVSGAFTQLFKRVAAVNKSNGPFHMMLCVGAFFTPYSTSLTVASTLSTESTESTTETALTMPEQLIPYKNKEQQVPLPVYFIANTLDDMRYLDALADSEGKICDGIQYLGKSGVKSIEGINVAYLSGSVAHPVKQVSDGKLDNSITKDDIASIIQQSTDKKIDILLTNQWARGVLNNMDLSVVSQTIKNPLVKGMDGIKEVAIALAPVYHFSKDSHYLQRPPYLNPMSKHNAATRFISLAPVPNEQKQKYLFAMNYQPNKTDTNILDTTGFPFAAVGGDKPDKRQRTDNNNKQQQQQNQQRKSLLGDYQQRSGDSKKRTSQQSTLECWFCLSQPSVESHLIVSIGSESYLALPKGGIVEHHSLVVFIDHKPSYTMLTDSERADVEKFIESLKQFHLKEDDCDIVVLERHFQGRFQNQLHGHLQVVPISKSLSAEKIEECFAKHGKQRNVEFKKLAIGSELAKAVGDNFYFNVRLPNGEQLYAIIEKEEQQPQQQHHQKHNNQQQQQQPVDFQFGRQVLVDLLGVPDRLNWKQCAVGKEKETEQANDFRTIFQPYYDSNE